MQKFILTAFLIIFMPSNASAQSGNQERNYKGGMQYTAMPKADQNQPLAPLNDTKNQAKAPKTTADTSASQDIWERYKALASGTAASHKENKDTPQKPAAPSQPTAKSKNTSPPPATGFAGIIQTHQKSKQAPRTNQDTTDQQARPP